MQITCRWITPRINCCRSLSSLQRDKYGHTCALLSRSHIASISPVMTYVSGLPPDMEKSTVVSRVLGKQFSNNQPISLFPMFSLTSRMIFSTAWLLNFRLASGIRTTGKSAPLPPPLPAPLNRPPTFAPSASRGPAIIAPPANIDC